MEIVGKMRFVIMLLQACLFTAVISGCRMLSKPDAVGRGDDAAITGRVKSAIADEPSLERARINIETYRGVVRLSGFVDSDEAIRTAGDIAAGIPGIVSVKNDLVVNDTGSSWRINREESAGA